LIQMQGEITPISDPHSSRQTNLADNDDSEPRLRLKMKIGGGSWSGKLMGVHGVHGYLYMAKAVRTPALTPTSLVDVLASGDGTHVVVMIRDNGPIYSSTNSGMTWLVVNTPGKHQFPLTAEPDGSSMFAEADLQASPLIPNSVPATNWYIVCTDTKGGKMILTANATQPAPALTIRQSGTGAVVSWPVVFTGFVLQHNDELDTNWTDVTAPVNVSGEEYQMFVSTPLDRGFYRLRSQTQ
jgi:hypothetical protein